MWSCGKFWRPLYPPRRGIGAWCSLTWYCITCSLFSDLTLLDYSTPVSLHHILPFSWFRNIIYMKMLSSQNLALNWSAPVLSHMSQTGLCLGVSYSGPCYVEAALYTHEVWVVSQASWIWNDWLIRCNAYHIIVCCDEPAGWMKVLLDTRDWRQHTHWHTSTSCGFRCGDSVLGGFFFFFAVLSSQIKVLHLKAGALNLS